MLKKAKTAKRSDFNRAASTPSLRNRVTSLHGICRQDRQIDVQSKLEFAPLEGGQH